MKTLLRTFSQITFLFLFSLSFSSKASSGDGKAVLDHLRDALNTLNFEAAFVVIDRKAAEPYRWAHGHHKEIELEHISSLNGHIFEMVRKDNVVSYFEGNEEPYSVTASAIKGPIPDVIFEPYDELSRYYNIAVAGKSRIAGRMAQLVRIIARDEDRFNYLIWLDVASGLLLKSATLNRKGDILEQLQVTQIQVTEHPSSQLLKLYDASLPSVSPAGPEKKTAENRWQLGWLPQGFNVINHDRHPLPVTNQFADYFLISDGLNEFSVYIQPPLATNNPPVMIQHGSMTIFSQVVNGVEFSVIGRIPAPTAEKIIKSVRLK